MSAELAFRTHFARNARHLVGERGQLVDHHVDGVLQLEDLAACVHGDLLREVTVGHGGRDLGDVADLAGEIAGHRVDVFGQPSPSAGNPLHFSLAAEFAFRTDFPGDTCHLVGEGGQLVDHHVDGVLQLEDLAACVHRDLLRQVTVGHRGRDLRDVAHLVGEVAGHQVDVFGESAPGAGYAFDFGLTAELAFRTDFACDARHFRRERAQLVDHRVERVFEL